ncbi:MAG: glycosyltransferase family 2 protein [Clostridiales Family XIII bacterium]|jgi:galactofuranosylgalactofuranosylrhamnosyl-N-acetylglucosaminyl-diphospho-decaprenol beta-1,5/1,6-galactofuranosyltransferase|nr:glycosyltransferase family 2 protein [Clostridiales Family XIII bacterium]
MNKLSIVITTYNKQNDVLKNLYELANADMLLHITDKIVVVDQSESGHEILVGPQSAIETDSKLRILSEKLQVVSQPNLGGSGGYSRGMYESLKSDNVGYVLLLDDDAVINSASIINTYNESVLISKSGKPTIIGGKMLPLDINKTEQAIEANLNRKIWVVQGESTDLKKVDFAGWWMCMIPREIIEKNGFAMPYFIKWDDVEYSLRAKAAGFGVRMLDDVYVRHETWEAKGNKYSWVSHYHERNKFITALIYSDYKRGRYAICFSLLAFIKSALITGPRKSAIAIRLSALQFVTDQRFSDTMNLHSYHKNLMQMSKNPPKISRLRAIFSAISVHTKLYVKWPKLREYYRDMQKSLVGIDFWTLQIK